MSNRYIIETKYGYVTSSSGKFTNDINSARTFKTESAAKTNKYMQSWRASYEGKIIPVNVVIVKAD